MRYFLSTLFFLTICISSGAQDSNKRLDWGIKGGFNSGISIIDEFTIDGIEIEHPENSYKVGVTGCMFMRLNLKKMYIQTEAGYYFTRGSQEFDIPDDYDDDNKADLNWELNTIGVPVLFGYHLIKEPPYGFNIYAGPKISKIFKSKNVFEIDENTYPLEYTFKPVNFSIVCGLGISISRLFVDFRYEFGVSNYIDHITYSSPIDNENPFGEIVLKGRMNAMSFSMGFIF